MQPWCLCPPEALAGMLFLHYSILGSPLGSSCFPPNLTFMSHTKCSISQRDPLKATLDGESWSRVLSSVSPPRGEEERQICL